VRVVAVLRGCARKRAVLQQSLPQAIHNACHSRCQLPILQPQRPWVLSGMVGSFDGAVTFAMPGWGIENARFDDNSLHIADVFAAMFAVQNLEIGYRSSEVRSHAFDIPRHVSSSMLINIRRVLLGLRNRMPRLRTRPWTTTLAVLLRHSLGHRLFPCRSTGESCGVV
jgi:hypothetical protein